MVSAETKVMAYDNLMKKGTSALSIFQIKNL